MLLFQFFPAMEPPKPQQPNPVAPAKPSPVETIPISGEKLGANQTDPLELAKALNEVIKHKNNVGKIVIVYFWAEGCTPCREYTPQVEKFVSGLDPKGHVFVKVDLSEAYRIGEQSIALSKLGQLENLPLVLSFLVRDEDKQAQLEADNAKKIAPTKGQSVSPEKPIRYLRRAEGHSNSLSGAEPDKLKVLLVPKPY